MFIISGSVGTGKSTAVKELASCIGGAELQQNLEGLKKIMDSTVMHIQVFFQTDYAEAVTDMISLSQNEEVGVMECDATESIAAFANLAYMKGSLSYQELKQLKKQAWKTNNRLPKNAIFVLVVSDIDDLFRRNMQR